MLDIISRWNDDVVQVSMIVGMVFVWYVLILLLKPISMVAGR